MDESEAAAKDTESSPLTKLQCLVKSNVQRDTAEAARRSGDRAKLESLSAGSKKYISEMERILELHIKVLRATLVDAAAYAASRGHWCFYVDMYPFIDQWVGLQHEAMFGCVFQQSLRNSGFVAIYYKGSLTMHTRDFLENPAEFLEKAKGSSLESSSSSQVDTKKSHRLIKPPVVDSAPSSQVPVGAAGAAGAAATSSATGSAVPAQPKSKSSDAVRGFFG